MKKLYLKFIYFIYKKSKEKLEQEYVLIKDIDTDFWEGVLL